MAPFTIRLLVAAAMLILLAPQHNVVVCAHKMKMKRQEFHVFFHDHFNVTSILVAPERVAGAITPTASSFGSFFCLHDPITAARERTSAILGTITGTSISAAFNGLTYFDSFTISLNTTTAAPAASPGTPRRLLGLQGTLAIVGLLDLLNPQPHVIVGGTGTFAFAQGTATIVPIDVRTFVQVYRLDLDVYWPPYAKA